MNDSLMIISRRNKNEKVPELTKTFNFTKGTMIPESISWAPVFSMNIKTPFKSPLGSFFEFPTTVKPTYSTYNFGQSISTNFPRQGPRVNPVLSVLEEGESTREEREVTDILQSQESDPHKEEDPTNAAYIDKGKGHAPFEFVSVAHISPVPSSPSTRRSAPLSIPDPSSDPDPSSSGSRNDANSSHPSSYRDQSNHGSLPYETSSPPCPPPPSPPPPSSPSNPGSNKEEDDDRGR